MGITAWPGDVMRYGSTRKDPRPFIPAADRARRYRQRVSNGRIMITIEIDDVAVPEALALHGFLPANLKDDRQAVARAVEKLIETLIVAERDA